MHKNSRDEGMEKIVNVGQYPCAKTQKNSRDEGRVKLVHIKMER
jgi:hypothetical protein